MLAGKHHPQVTLERAYTVDKLKEKDDEKYEVRTVNNKDMVEVGKSSAFSSTSLSSKNYSKPITPSDTYGGLSHISRHTTSISDSGSDIEGGRTYLSANEIESIDAHSELEGENSEEGYNNTEIQYPDGGLKAYLVIFGAFIGMIPGFGIMNATGAFESWIKTHQLKDAPSTEVSWIFAIYSFLAFGGCVYSGPLFDTFGTKTVGIPGSMMIVGGLLGTANATKAYQFILAFGVCCGVGSALIISPIVSCTSHWFHKRRGFAVGISMTGASLGGMIIPLMCNGLYPKVGFTWTMRILALFAAVLLGISMFLLDDRVKEFNDAENDTRSIFQKIKDSIDFSGLKDRRYLVLVLALFMNEFSIILIFTYISSYALSRGFSTSTSFFILTVVNASGMAGRYIPSHLSDHYGKFNLIVCCSLLMSFSILVIWLPFGEKLPVFYFFGVLYGFTGAGTLSLTPSCTGQISKTKDFGKRYGTAYFFVSFGNLICIPAGMGIASSGTKVAFDNMVIFGGVTCFVGSCFFLLCRYLIGGFKPIV